MSSTERLIREAFEAEADLAVDPRHVLAELERRRARPRRRGLVVLTAAAVVIAAAVAVVVPRALDRAAPPPVASPGATTQNILVAGLDDNGTTDSLVLGHLGSGGSASAVSLPRDSWVDVPGLGMHKLNSAYSRGGATALVGAVQELTGTKVDHYVLVDMAGFDRLSAAVGGVPVCLRAATHDPISGASFGAGEQTLSGPSALAFLRQRHGLPHGDLDRITRLQAFLRSLATKVITSGKLADHEFLTTVRDAVRVDPGWNLLDLASRLGAVHNVRLATVPVRNTDLQGPEGAAIQVDPQQVRSFVREFTGSGAPPADGGSCVN
ncbi:LCP family protein [Amycolatopsis rhabdoformis]|uniref:LCP family protein n=1 Tax=Amycolatopsis rhabdoformis TaxID=1448059 RepID=A0ABZ1IHV5_9PSEU|nr:LCP family protein [Amycolatopsis rhabdoformis]WSE33527.1 LCP family protein [Amycolatopsis rhabdoformis]